MKLSASPTVTLTVLTRNGTPSIICGNGFDTTVTAAVYGVDVDRRADHDVAEVERARVGGHHHGEPERGSVIGAREVDAARLGEGSGPRASGRRGRADLRRGRAATGVRFGRYDFGLTALRDPGDPADQALRHVDRQP